MSKIYKLKGWLINMDRYGYAHLSFLSAYNGGKRDDSPTYQKIKSLSEFFESSSPLEGKNFKIKLTSRTLCSIDNIVCKINNLMSQAVEISARTHNYNFTKNGKHIAGWKFVAKNIKLLKTKT